MFAITPLFAICYAICGALCAAAIVYDAAIADAPLLFRRAMVTSAVILPLCHCYKSAMSLPCLPLVAHTYLLFAVITSAYAYTYFSLLLVII